jgi:hypothetical protein
LRGEIKRPGKSLVAVFRAFEKQFSVILTNM